MRIPFFLNAAIVLASSTALPCSAAGAAESIHEVVQMGLTRVARDSRIPKSEADLAAAAGRALRAEQAASVAGLSPNPPTTFSQLMGEYRLVADGQDVATAARLAKVMVEAAIAATGDEGQFLSVKELSRPDDKKGGSVGITLKIYNDRLTVVRLPAGSVLREQVRPGDRITAINGQLTAGQSLEWAIAQLYGSVGSEATLALESSAGTKRSLAAARVPGSQLGIESSISGGTGYIRLDSFRAGDPKLIGERINRLKSQGATAFILDLRYNPGGLLDAVIEVADHFLEEGRILSNFGRTPTDIERYFAKPGDLLNGARLIVLVGPETGNGAEAVARSLQYFKRALIVGEPTAGKAFVRSAVMVSSEFVLLLPTSDLRGPDDVPIDGHPIKPDVVIHNVNLQRDSQLEAAQLIASTKP